MKLMKLQANSGFTLFEIVIVIGIIVLVSALLLFPLSSFRVEAILDGAAEETLALLHEARERTVSSDGASRYGVYFESNQVTLFKGASFPGAGDANNKVIFLNSRLALSTSAGLASGAIFERLTGALANGGTVTISLISDNTKQRVIEISAAGLASLVKN